MAFDFPASPSIGQIYTSNGASFIWDGTKWKVVAVDSPYVLPKNNPVVSGVLSFEADTQPRVYASRNVGWETLNSPAAGLYGPANILSENVGGFTNPGGAGSGGGLGLVVPKTGRYLIMHRVFFKVDSAGRIFLQTTGGTTLAMAIAGGQTGTDKTVTDTAVAHLAAGTMLGYNADIPCTVYTAAGYTRLGLYYLG